MMTAFMEGGIVVWVIAGLSVVGKTFGVPRQRRSVRNVKL
jgi:hypothetical protein